MAAEDHIILFNLHHIICDGWSLGVLVRETMALYGAFAKAKPSPLPTLAVQYGDYAAWQRSKLQVDVVEKQMAFWREASRRRANFNRSAFRSSAAARPDISRQTPRRDA